MSEPLQPQQEVEVQGGVGEALALPVANDDASAYVWTLELPAGVEDAGPTPVTDPTADEHPRAGGWLRVRALRPGSHVLTATLADPSASAPMTVQLIRLTVA